MKIKNNWIAVLLVAISLLSVWGMGSLLVSADTTQIDAELGGYDDIFRLSEIKVDGNILNIYKIEQLDRDGIEKELKSIGIEMEKDITTEHEIYNLRYKDSIIGDILINDYVTSINLNSRVKVLGDIDLVGDTCRKELEYILNYKEDDMNSWYGTLNKGKTTYDWGIDIGDENEEQALGFIYNENELQINEYRVRFGFDKDGNVVGLQFNMFHGEIAETV